MPGPRLWVVLPALALAGADPNKPRDYDDRSDVLGVRNGANDDGDLKKAYWAGRPGRALKLSPSWL